jgi:hypothetical protein
MEKDVFSWKVAISKGYEPRLYTYDANQIPIGEYEVRLDFKIWSKKLLAINCYFTKIDTGNKFVLPVYCHSKTGQYTVKDTDLNFALCPNNSICRIATSKNSANKLLLVKAEIIALSTTKN